MKHHIIYGVNNEFNLLYISLLYQLNSFICLPKKKPDVTKKNGTAIREIPSTMKYSNKESILMFFKLLGTCILTTIHAAINENIEILSLNCFGILCIALYKH